MPNTFSKIKTEPNGHRSCCCNSCFNILGQKYYPAFLQVFSYTYPVRFFTKSERASMIKLIHRNSTILNGSPILKIGAMIRYSHLLLIGKLRIFLRILPWYDCLTPQSLIDVSSELFKITTSSCFLATLCHRRNPTSPVLKLGLWFTPSPVIPT